jgi:hypothetical protein
MAPIELPASEAATGTVRLNFGGVVWEMRSDVPGLQVEVDPRTCEFICGSDVRPDAVVDIKWAASFPAAGPVLFNAGLWRAYHAGDGLQFDFITERLGDAPYKRAIFDAEFNRGLVLLNRRLLDQVEAYYPLEYPLDELASMHRLSRGHGVELHSCGLATADGRGFLFVGHSGAGKSTLGKLWAKCRNAAILSDDRIIVTRSGDRYLIHGTPWHGEAGLATNANASLQGIFLIEHGSANETVPLPPSKAGAELLSRSFVPWYRPENLDFSLSFVQQLVASVPVYVFGCLPDVSAIEYLERVHAI